jgi:hypothetical protein
MMLPVNRAHAHTHTGEYPAPAGRLSILARSAWLRLVLLLPACVLLWLGVWWALAGELR